MLPVLTVSKGGCVMVALAVAVHPLASVAVTVYVPAVSPVMEDDIALLLHE